MIMDEILSKKHPMYSFENVGGFRAIRKSCH
jgi:hypothetical protein